MLGIYTLLKKLKEHFDIMIFIERYPLKRYQGCVKPIASQLFFKHYWFEWGAIMHVL